MTGRTDEQFGGNLPQACREADEVLVELALGQVGGEPRAQALAHVDGCARCTAELGSLAAVADELLALVPPAEPPAGFESRVLARVGAVGEAAPAPPPPFSPARRLPAGARERGGAGGDGTASRVRARAGLVLRPGVGFRRLAAAAVVAAVVAAGGFAAGTAVTGRAPGQARTQSGGPLRTAAFFSGGHQVGRVMVYAGNPTWLFMWVDDPAWQGALRCQVVEDAGPVLDLGQFWLSGGRGAWAQQVAEPAGRLREARIVGAGGTVLAVAQLG